MQAAAAECETDAARDRFYAIDAELKAALRKRDDREASRLADEYLALASNHKDDWNYGNAIHDANLALGMVALRANQGALADEYLLKAGATPGSPQLDSFGPDLSLANALLAEGHLETVIRYLKAIGSFWKSGREALPGVIASVEKGEKRSLRPEDFWTASNEKLGDTLSAKDGCIVGYELSRNGFEEESVELLTACLASSDVSRDEKRLAHVARAWAYMTIGKNNEAVADQEAAFTLGEPLINHGIYLRRAGRADESIAPLLKAEAMEATKGQPSMMTEYQLGWSYQAAGKHVEAVAAFTRGIPAQPDYPFAYYMRGLSFESLGKTTEARQDFEKAGHLIAVQRTGGASEAELEPVRRKLVQYGIR